jgi:hypothetical protein
MLLNVHHSRIGDAMAGTGVATDDLELATRSLLHALFQRNPGPQKLVSSLLSFPARSLAPLRSRIGHCHQSSPHDWQQQGSEEEKTVSPPTSRGMNTVSLTVGSNWRRGSEAPSRFVARSNERPNQLYDCDRDGER